MRVTQNQITRQYINSSNSSLSNMTDINNKVLTGRSFNKASEDPVGATHAMNIRNSLDNIDMYESNLKTAEGIFDSAESALRNISSITTSVTDSIISGVNGDKGDAEREIIGNQINNLADEMIAQVNTNFAGRFLFGGTNNSTPPIAIDDVTGQITYNGVATTENDVTAFPQNNSIPVDIGLGIKFDSAGKVDDQTVLDMSLSGVEYLGHGTDSDGDAKNLIQLTLDAAKAVKSGDNETARRLLDKINNSKSNVLIGITTIGNKEKTVKFSQDRIAKDEINLAEAQNTVECCDKTEEITNLKVAEMAYNATLSMSSYVVPQSIFDYMR